MHKSASYLSVMGFVLFCGEPHDEAQPGFLTAGGKTVATVTVNPDSLTLQVGDIGRATCTPQNKFGAVLTNTCTWTSRDTTVAKPTSGSQSSSITARKVGNTWVVATAGGKRDSTRVSVVDTVTPPPPPPPDTTPPPPVACDTNRSALQFGGFFEGTAPFKRWSVNESGTLPYSRAQVTTLVRECSAAVRIELRKSDPLVAGSYRSELKLLPDSVNGSVTGPVIGTLGSELWMGWSIYVPADWVFESGYAPETVTQIGPGGNAGQSPP